MNLNWTCVATCGSGSVMRSSSPGLSWKAVADTRPADSAVGGASSGMSLPGAAPMRLCRTASSLGSFPLNTVDLCAWRFLYRERTSSHLPGVISSSASTALRSGPAPSPVLQFHTSSTPLASGDEWWASDGARTLTCVTTNAAPSAVPRSRTTKSTASTVRTSMHACVDSRSGAACAAESASRTAATSRGSSSASAGLSDTCGCATSMDTWRCWDSESISTRSRRWRDPSASSDSDPSTWRSWFSTHARRADNCGKNSGAPTARAASASHATSTGVSSLSTNACSACCKPVKHAAPASLSSPTSRREALAATTRCKLTSTSRRATEVAKVRSCASASTSLAASMRCSSVCTSCSVRRDASTANGTWSDVVSPLWI